MKASNPLASVNTICFTVNCDNETCHCLGSRNSCNCQGRCDVDCKCQGRIHMIPVGDSKL